MRAVLPIPALSIEPGSKGVHSGTQVGDLDLFVVSAALSTQS